MALSARKLLASLDQAIFDISQIDKDFETIENSGTSRMGLLVWSLKLSHNSYFGIHVHVPGYT